MLFVKVWVLVKCVDYKIGGNKIIILYIENGYSMFWKGVKYLLFIWVSLFFNFWEFFLWFNFFFNLLIKFNICVNCK